MRITAITEQGLRWIAALVVVLWGCIVTEDSLMKHARHESKAVLVELRQMRRGQRPLPASSPIHQPVVFSKPAIG